MNPRCPCGTGDVYPDCCGRFHSGKAIAPTAQALMRSRYTAFAFGLPDYLRDTWHSSTRPKTVDLGDGIVWRRLEIVDVVAGGPFDDTGIVEFRAHYRADGESHVMQERSTFVRENGRWYYVSG